MSRTIKKMSRKSSKITSNEQNCLLIPNIKLEINLENILSGIKFL